MRRFITFILLFSFILLFAACELKEPPEGIAPSTTAPTVQTVDVLPGDYNAPQLDPESPAMSSLELKADGTFTFMYNLARDFLPTGNWEFKDGKLYCDCTATDEIFVFEPVDERSYRFLSDESTFFDFEGEHVDDLKENPIYTLESNFLMEQNNLEDIDKFNRFLLALCDKLVDTDPALAWDAVQMSIVVDGADFTPEQQAEFKAIVKDNLDLEVLFLTHKELKEQGYLIEDGLYWEDGFLVSVTVQEMQEDQISFDAELWRSGLGAIMPTENTATFDGTSWTIEFGPIAAA